MGTEERQAFIAPFFRSEIREWKMRSGLFAVTLPVRAKPRFGARVSRVHTSFHGGVSDCLH